jgi:hypothetical protein
MEVALLLRGAVAKKSGRLLAPLNINNVEDDFINFKAVALSIRKNIILSNPDSNVETYIQSWNPELEEELINLYAPIASTFEMNARYDFEIRNMASISAYNKFVLFEKMNHRLNGRRSEFITPKDFLKLINPVDFAGISQSLAIRKSISLFWAHRNRAKRYDLIVIYRPDVILLKPMIFHRYDSNAITVNRYQNSLGDFHWVLPEEYLSVMHDLYSSISGGNIHEQHFWIKRYIERFYNIPYRMDEIQAGTDQEVCRQINIGNIAYSQVQEFGISKSEWEEYSITK